MRFPLLLLALGLLAGTRAEAAAPVITNVRAAQRSGSQLVDVYYNVSAATSTVKISALVSADGGATWTVPAITFTGAYGAGVTTGNDRLLTWNAGLDWGGQFSTACRVRVIADDGTAPPAPAGMAYIPAGVFQMGDNFYDITDALPPHNTFVSAFFMDKNLIAREQWLEVYAWALGHGYTFNNGGQFKDAKHPVHSISWYDAVKWCNARSEKEGLTPCYYTDAGQTAVYRTGQVDLANNAVKWAANGYRLPTEAEWEKAARGGLRGKRFPWGDTITHSQANYFSSAGYAYDISKTRGYHPTYGRGTSPVGVFPANGYGLYDMAGNVFQRCWDGYGDTWYGQPGATADDSRGPTFVSNRVLRGGSWDSFAGYLRCANRSINPPTNADDSIGFRCVRGL